MSVSRLTRRFSKLGLWLGSSSQHSKIVLKTFSGQSAGLDRRCPLKTILWISLSALSDAKMEEYRYRIKRRVISQTNSEGSSSMHAGTDVRQTSFVYLCLYVLLYGLICYRAYSYWKYVRNESYFTWSQYAFVNHWKLASLLMVMVLAILIYLTHSQAPRTIACFPRICWKPSASQQIMTLLVPLSPSNIYVCPAFNRD